MPALLKKLHTVLMDIPLLVFFWFNQLDHQNCCNLIKELGLKKIFYEIIQKRCFLLQCSIKIYKKCLLSYSGVMKKSSYSNYILYLSPLKLSLCLPFL